MSQVILLGSRSFCILSETPDHISFGCKRFMRLPRLERGTYCLGGSRSIHLSYRREGWIRTAAIMTYLIWGVKFALIWSAVKPPDLSVGI
jgi:hypothetical protein